MKKRDEQKEINRLHLMSAGGAETRGDDNTSSITVRPVRPGSLEQINVGVEVLSECDHLR